MRNHPKDDQSTARLMQRDISSVGFAERTPISLFACAVIVLRRQPQIWGVDRRCRRIRFRNMPVCDPISSVNANGDEQKGTPHVL